MSRQAVARHLAVQEECRLAQRRRAGREVLYQVQPDRLAELARGLAGRAEAWRSRLELLKREAGACPPAGIAPGRVKMQSIAINPPLTRVFGRSRDVAHWIRGPD